MNAHEYHNLQTQWYALVDMSAAAHHKGDTKKRDELIKRYRQIESKLAKYEAEV